MRLSPKLLKLSAAGLISIAVAEGYRGGAYLDTVGVPTIGFGETLDVKMGQKTSPERALIKLLASADKHSQGAMKCLGDIPLYQYEYDAISSFTYNIGIKGWCSSTPLKLFQEGKYAEACNSMILWTKNKELIGRRKEEIEMCHGG